MVVPGLNDKIEDVISMAAEVRIYPPELVEKVEMLPYHTLGTYKYGEMGIRYRLEGVRPMDADRLCVLWDCGGELLGSYNVV